MVLSGDLVKKFQDLHFKKFGVEIDAKTARKDLTDLAMLVRLTSESRETP